MPTARLTTVAAALVLAAAAGAGAAGAPTLRLLGLTPAARVHGAQFKPGERVGVTLSAGTVRRKLTTYASSAGGFTVDFGRLPERSRCGAAISVLAVGANGDRVVFKLPLLACPTSSSTGYAR